MRWRLKLGDFQYEIVYKSRKTNKNERNEERNEACVYEIRILPLNLVDSVKERRKRRRPKRKVKHSSEMSDRIPPETKSDEPGITSLYSM